MSSHSSRDILSSSNVSSSGKQRESNDDNIEDMNRKMGDMNIAAMGGCDGKGPGKQVPVHSMVDPAEKNPFNDPQQFQQMMKIYQQQQMQIQQQQMQIQQLMSARTNESRAPSPIIENELKVQAQAPMIDRSKKPMVPSLQLSNMPKHQNSDPAPSSNQAANPQPRMVKRLPNYSRPNNLDETKSNDNDNDGDEDYTGESDIDARSNLSSKRSTRSTSKAPSIKNDPMSTSMPALMPPPNALSQRSTMSEPSDAIKKMNGYQDYMNSKNVVMPERPKVERMEIFQQAVQCLHELDELGAKNSTLERSQTAMIKHQAAYQTTGSTKSQYEFNRHSRVVAILKYLQELEQAFPGGNLRATTRKMMRS